MTKFRKKEIEVAGKEGQAFSLMQVAENLLAVIPLRSPDVKANLSVVNSPLLKLRGLISGDIVIEDDQ